MPYFTWRGVDITASLHKGYAYAESIPHLDEVLFRQNIALLHARKKSSPLWHTRLSVSLKIQWLKQFALLLQSGVPMVRALYTVRSQSSTILYDITTRMIKDIERGTPLFQALAGAEIFDPFVIAMARAGGEAGTMAAALYAAVDHIEKKDLFIRKIRMAALVPCITLGVFFVVMAVIVTCIIPKFATLYSNMHQELPWITQVLLKMNNVWTQAHGFLYIGVGILLVGIVYIKHVEVYKKIYYTLPGVGKLAQESSIFEYVSMCALLTQQGVPLVSALKTAHAGVVYEPLSMALGMMICDVEAGVPLSVAVTRHGERYFNSSCSAFIAVGEETGVLPAMLVKVAALIQHSFEQKLMLITTLFQPVLIIVLGFFVVMLLMASYMPIFNMSFIM